MLAAHEEVAYRNIEVTPTDMAIGALVECGEVSTLDAATFDELQRAFLDNLASCNARNAKASPSLKETRANQALVTREPQPSSDVSGESPPALVSPP